MRREFLLKSGEKKLGLGQKTCLMGILNITPDSFSDGGLYLQPEKAEAQAEQLIEQGADILDLGGQSTRPESKPVGTREELNRILPVLSRIRKKSSIWISIDTYRSEVAKACLEEGADMINDVSSFRMDPEMAPLIARTGVPVVCMHFLRSIHPMPANPEYQDLFGEILAFFHETFRMAEVAGANPDQLVIDPGIGFGKTLEHNLKIMKGLSFLNQLERPIMAGPSRKSFIGKITGQSVETRLEGTAAAAGYCVVQGAHILRVHEAGFFRHYCKVLDAIINS